ncbi:MAG: 1-deoxy-D-xylulose-5-phosphate reductoisomerase [Candidatus Omnitrophica bacterium]|nr:1-deoxy-D-xylulose-5-phosphate reductoisomerase [Candidatus Omnitrophota bacterium]
MKNIAILGSTGSIGTNALKIVRSRPKDFNVIGISGYSNVSLLAKQIKEFNPEIVSVKDDAVIKKLEKLVSLKGIKVYAQNIGLNKIVINKKVKTILVATSGTVSLEPTLEAIERGKIIALANKEPLVMAGQIVMERIKKNKGYLIPVDSEHSAIFQCLKNEDIKKLRKIYLTGSGGPFKKLKKSQLEKVTLAMALKHPKWKMGKKITIDSATLMNKGLELIEARWLFDVEPEKIEVIIHPEAVIHSMVEFCDRSIIAQLGITDMRLPIQYAFDYPQRIDNDLQSINFLKTKALTFLKPDLLSFPCLAIAKQVALKGGSCGAVMNAVNEIAVQAFLSEKIKFIEIPKIVSGVLKKHLFIKRPNLDEILKLDIWARREAELLCYQH